MIELAIREDGLVCCNTYPRERVDEFFRSIEDKHDYDDGYFHYASLPYLVYALDTNFSKTIKDIFAEWKSIRSECIKKQESYETRFRIPQTPPQSMHDFLDTTD